ncbi:MAG: patatin-like phospholipase family protein [Candidatus Nanopelagicales bacterium]
MATREFTVPPPRAQPPEQRRHPVRIAHLLPRPVHYVLSGGGAHGSVQWGLLQALSETDLAPDALIGTSAGALTAAIYAEDPLAAVNRLAYVWNQLDLQVLMGDGWLRMLRSATSRGEGIAENNAEQDALESILAARDFSDLTLPCAAVATDLATGLARAFDTGPLIPALLASSAIPAVLPPVSIDGRRYIDGLASANLPAQLAVARGARSIVVLDTGSRTAAENGVSTPKVIARITAILNAAQRRTQLAAAARHVPVLLLPTPQNLGASMDFSGAADAAAESYELGRAFLSALHDQHSRRLNRGLYADGSTDASDPEIAAILKLVG